MSCKKKKKNWKSASRIELLNEISRLEFTVKRRGYQIGGLYNSLQNVLDGNPGTYTLGNVTSDNADEVVKNMKKELESARTHIKQLISNKSEKHEENNIPKGFDCNICFESYDTENKKPIALSCGHIICEMCLITYTKKIKDAGCPTCRKKIERVFVLYV